MGQALSSLAATSTRVGDSGPMSTRSLRPLTLMRIIFSPLHHWPTQAGLSAAPAASTFMRSAAAQAGLSPGPAVSTSMRSAAAPAAPAAPLPASAAAAGLSPSPASIADSSGPPAASTWPLPAGWPLVLWSSAARTGPCSGRAPSAAWLSAVAATLASELAVVPLVPRLPAASTALAPAATSTSIGPAKVPAASWRASMPVTPAAT
mmetsp:Transcript_65472/g.211102  ORF Transcript_65472/g.211102 Transcript_65472/m.211102 type:complete len:206 (+) Transcript_65472:197-814(+)